jgi:hypothetical protein
MHIRPSKNDAERIFLGRTSNYVIRNHVIRNQIIQNQVIGNSVIWEKAIGNQATRNHAMCIWTIRYKKKIMGWGRPAWGEAVEVIGCVM